MNLLVASAFVIQPLIDYFKRAVLDDSVIGTDDTSVTLLLPKDIPKPDEGDPKSRRIHDVFTKAVANGKPSVSARMWAYRGVTVPLNVFDFTVSWHRDGPAAFFVCGSCCVCVKWFLTDQCGLRWNFARKLLVAS